MLHPTGSERSYLTNLQTKSRSRADFLGIIRLEPRSRNHQVGIEIHRDVSPHLRDQLLRKDEHANLCMDIFLRRLGNTAAHPPSWIDVHCTSSLNLSRQENSLATRLRTIRRLCHVPTGQFAACYHPGSLVQYLDRSAPGHCRRPFASPGVKDRRHH